MLWPGHRPTLKRVPFLYVLHAKLHLLVLHHQVADILDRQIPKQLDVVASDLIEEVRVRTPETEPKGKVVSPSVL